MHRNGQSTIEALGQRRHLSVAVGDSSSNVTGTPGDDVIAIGVKPNRTSWVNIDINGVTERVRVSRSTSWINVDGLGGNDTIRVDLSAAPKGWGHFLYISGSDGDDFISCWADGASIWGGAGDDVIIGGPSGDAIWGAGGNDQIDGRAGPDRLLAGDAENAWDDDDPDGNNTLVGGKGDDILFGGAGNDRLVGEGGTDRLLGYLGNDRLLGGAGDDYVNGHEGRDVVRGGTGYDAFNQIDRLEIETDWSDEFDSSSFWGPTPSGESYYRSEGFTGLFANFPGGFSRGNMWL